MVGGAIIAVARTGVGPDPRAAGSRRRCWRVAAGVATALVFAVGGQYWGYVPFVIMPWIALRLGTSAVAVVGALVAIVAAQEVSLAPMLWDEIDVAPEHGRSSTCRSRSRC